MVEKFVGENSKISFYKFRALLNRSKKKSLKKITSKIVKILGDNSDYIYLHHLFSFILDIIDAKLYVSKTATIQKRSPPK